MGNMITVVGNIGWRSELQKAGDGVVINFSVATNYGKDKNGKDKTTWFTTAIWNQGAEALDKWLQVGKTVEFSGRMVADEDGNCPIWVGKDGTPKAVFKVDMVGGVQLHGGSKNAEPSREPVLTDSNDIPF